MAYPDPDEVSVATTALRAEAGERQTQSAALAGLTATVSLMEFGRLEACLFQLMVAPYNDVIGAVAARCGEGAAAMIEIADTLRSVADTYDAEDRESLHQIKNVY